MPSTEQQLHSVICSHSNLHYRLSGKLPPTFFGYQLDSSFRASDRQLAELLHAVQCLSSNCMR